MNNLPTKNIYTKKVIDTVISLLDESNTAQIEKLCKALSSPVRLAIIRQLHEKPATIVELAKANGITNSTVIFHLQLLQDAKLVKTQYLPSKKGTAQVQFVSFYNIVFTREGGKDQRNSHLHEQSVRVGDYVDARFPGFGFATKDEMYHLEVTEFHPRRHDAVIVWGQRRASATYAFDNTVFLQKNVFKLQFSFELCSETTNYRNDWKSDIFFAINGIEVAHYLSPGDFGGTRGTYTPPWWPQNMTQYGNLVLLTVTNDGTYVDNTRVGDATLSSLAPTGSNRITLSIYCKEDSAYCGGFNLFGKGSGNFDQDIVMQVFYTE